MGKKPSSRSQEVREAARKAQKKWRDKNPDKVKGIRDRYYQKNAEKLRKVAEEFRAKNPEKVKESQKQYLERNPEKAKKSRDNWRANNVERERERSRRKSAALTPEQKREYSRRAKDELRDSYVRGMLSTKLQLSYKEIPQEIVDLKRAMILLMRLMKEAGYSTRGGKRGTA